MSELEVELREAQWGVENAAHAGFILLVTELLRELQEHAPLAPSMVGGLVHDALTFIEAHCFRPLSLQDVAAAVGCTPLHLANVIRKGTGLTVGDWLREHRMAEARRRLLETGASAMETLADRTSPQMRTYEIDPASRRHKGMSLVDAPGEPRPMLRGDMENSLFSALPKDVEIRYVGMASSRTSSAREPASCLTIDAPGLLTPRGRRSPRRNWSP